MPAEGASIETQPSFLDRLLKPFRSIAPSTDRKRPTNLLFDVSETPPLAVAIAAALQHIFLMSVGWLYIVLLANSASVPAEQTQNLIRLSMIASGVATILQAQGGILGSGYLTPLTGSLTFLPSSILAIRIGGFPLLFGMIVIAGIATCFLSQVTYRLRALFPPEVTGLMIAMSGLQLIALGCPRFVGYTGPGFVPNWHTVLVGMATLLVMIGATVWNKGKLHALPILAGLTVGYVLAVSLNVIPLQEFMMEVRDPWIGTPRFGGGLAFSTALLAPFLIACLTANLKSVGDITLCQKINDDNWRRTDMRSVSGGIFANGVGLMLSGLTGATAQNTLSSSIGLSVASGMTSRSLAYPIGVGVIALAFVPKVAALFAAMPAPAMGAMLIYSACFIVLGGVQLIASRMLDSRRIFAVGIALIFGLSLEISPDVYRSVPAILQPVFTSSASLTTVLVVLLSLLFRIGIGKQKTISLSFSECTSEAIHRLLEEQGSAWGMRRDVIVRAEHAVYEAVTIIQEVSSMASRVTLVISFDEINLDVDLEYEGPALELATRPPSIDEIEDERSVLAMAGYLVRQYSDRVRIKSAQNVSRVQLHFDH